MPQKYKIVKSSELTDFEGQIEFLLDSGWELYKSPGFNRYGFWFQALVKV